MQQRLLRLGQLGALILAALLGGCGGTIDGGTSGGTIDDGGTLDGKVDERFSGSQVEAGAPSGSPVEDGSTSGAKTYGASDVANGTCAPVVGKPSACGSATSLDGICTSGTKAVAHVLQQDLVGGVTGMRYQCLDAKGAVLGDMNVAGSCASVGDWYAEAYQSCALNHQVLGSFRMAGTTCSLPVTTCSIVVTCCPA